MRMRPGVREIALWWWDRTGWCPTLRWVGIWVLNHTLLSYEVWEDGVWKKMC